MAPRKQLIQDIGQTQPDLALDGVREPEVSEDVSGSASHGSSVASSPDLRQISHRRSVTLDELRPEPTLDDVRRDYEPSPVNQEEEVPELVGLCLWDIFSDNHDIIAADGRFADIGSFRGAGAFLDEYLTRDQESWSDGDYMRFYMGTIAGLGAWRP